MVSLGNRFKRYLGLYPAGAYLEAIEDGRVIGAFQGVKLVGYVLFDLPRADIRLVHLCVSETNRGTGVAASLVRKIQELHGDRTGIRLKCRSDYAASRVWPKLGFRAQSLPTGRGRDKAEMVAWWKDFGHPDLFAAALEGDKRLLVILDTNAVLDVVLDRAPRMKEALEAPALDGEVVFCITTSIRNEVSALKDATARRRAMLGLGKFQTLHSDADVAGSVAQELAAGVDPLEFENDSSLVNDIRIVAESLVAGASVILTSDDNATRVLGPAAKKQGLAMLHPSQLVVVLEELKGLRLGAPVRIQHTSVLSLPAVPGVDRELGHLISSHSGESRTAFLEHLRSRAASGVRTIHIEGGSLADALLATSSVGDVLRVDLLRVRSFPLAQTLLRQLLFQLRHEALRLGASRIVITDPHPGGGESPIRLLEEDGARLLEGQWTLLVIDAIYTMHELMAQSSLNSDLEQWTDGDLDATSYYAQLEHELWPLKIRDSPLPCYIVPIRQHFASELLGYDEPLLDRPSLGISRRHVYYKTPNYTFSSPGRLLWYVSGPWGGSIVAASQLVSSHRASPRTLFSRFENYGVWTLDHVEAASRRGRALAVRFGDTEVFNRGVRMSVADSIVKSHGQALGNMRTVRRIAGEAFEEIYSRGMKG